VIILSKTNININNNATNVKLILSYRKLPAIVRHHLFYISFYRAMLCISAAFAVMRCPSVRPSGCLSHSCILLKWVNVFSNFFHRLVDQPF